MALASLHNLSVSSDLLSLAKTNASPASYGYKFLLPQLVESLPEIFSKQNYRSEFQNHPEQAGSLRRLLNLESYAQLEKLLGTDKLLTLNNICTEDKDTLVHHDILAVAVELEDGVHHGLALSLYQAVAAQGGDTEARAAKFYEMANGGGSSVERLEYNLRHFNEHISKAMIAGLSAGMLVGTGARYLTLKGLRRIISPFWRATGLGGQITAKTLAFGLEVPSVVIADQSFRPGSQNWSASHLWDASLHMGLNLLVLKGVMKTASTSFYGLQGINPALGPTLSLMGTRRFAQQLLMPSAMTAGIYAGPSAQDLVFGNHTTLGQGRTLVDAAFGALSFTLAAKLTHGLTPTQVTTYLRNLEIQSHGMMKGMANYTRAKLHTWWQDGNSSHTNGPFSSRHAHGIAGVGGQVTKVLNQLPERTGHPLDRKNSVAPMAKINWPWERKPQTGEAPLVTKLDKPVRSPLTESDVGLVYADRDSSRRYVLTYQGRRESPQTISTPAPKGPYDLWTLKIRPSFGTQFHLPKQLILESGEYSFVKSIVHLKAGPTNKVELHSSASAMGIASDIGIFRKGKISARVQAEAKARPTECKIGDLLAFPKEKILIELQHFSEAEAKVKEEAWEAAESVERPPWQEGMVLRNLSDQEPIVLGQTYLPNIGGVKLQYVKGLNPINLAFHLDREGSITLSAYHPGPRSNSLHYPLLDSEGRNLQNKALPLSMGDNWVFLRPLKSDGTWSEGQLEVFLRISNLPGLDLEPKAVAISLGQINGRRVELIPPPIPLVEDISRDWGPQRRWAHASWLVNRTVRLSTGLPEPHPITSRSASGSQPDTMFSGRTEDNEAVGPSNLDAGILETKRVEEFTRNFRLLSPKQIVILESQRLLGDAVPILVNSSSLDTQGTTWPNISLSVDLKSFRRALRRLPQPGEQSLEFSLLGSLKTPQIQVGEHTFNLNVEKGPYGPKFVNIKLNVMEPKILDVDQTNQAFANFFKALGFVEKS